MSQHDYQKYERAKVKNFPDVFLMAFCSILVSCISYPWVDAKWNVLAGKKLKKKESENITHYSNRWFPYHP